MVNRSKRAIEFELVDAQDLGTGRLEAKSVRYVPALPATLGPRESIMVEVREHNPSFFGVSWQSQGGVFVRPTGVSVERWRGGCRKFVLP